jgi:ammonium transporter, Amt family
LKNKLGWDDALDVWGVHGIGGALGVILLGVFASKAVNAGGADGLLAGGTHFFAVQCLAVVGAALYAFLFTYLMLAVINLFTTVKVSETDEDLGLDASLHGERAYDSGAL